MEHTLEVGDRILVNRTSYFFSEPQAGDVVVFSTPEEWHDAPTVVIDSPFEWVVRLFGEVTGIGPAMSTSMVKRIVASPGQVLSCCGPGGQLTVDGVPLDVPETGIGFQQSNGGVAQPTVSNCEDEGTTADCPEPFTVPEGEYVLLGDNRPGSSDSLSQCYPVAEGTLLADCIRTASRDDLVGTVFMVAFPNPRGVS